LHPDADNDLLEVLKLQIFLNTWMDADLELTSEYDAFTEAAVRDSQSKFAEDILSPWEINESIGRMYITTRAKINSLLCPDLANEPLPDLIPYSESQI
jgi:hypothetical protein